MARKKRAHRCARCLKPIRGRIAYINSKKVCSDCFYKLKRRKPHISIQEYWRKYVIGK